MRRDGFIHAEPQFHEIMLMSSTFLDHTYKWGSRVDLIIVVEYFILKMDFGLFFFDLHIMFQMCKITMLNNNSTWYAFILSIQINSMHYIVNRKTPREACANQANKNEAQLKRGISVQRGSTSTYLE